MINRVTGEIAFQSGLNIAPLQPIRSGRQMESIPLKCWTRHELGLQSSEHGTFEVEAVSAEEGRVVAVFLSHQHSFYESDTPEDADRKAFHEGVIGKDLGGQREFSWGEVACRLDPKQNQDWLVVAYRREANVPLHEKDDLLQLMAREKTSDQLK